MRSSFNHAGLLCILLFVTGFFLFFKLGSLPLADPDEPRYAESAREMIEQGSVMVPYFNYAPRLEKPVLYYWTICLSYLFLGVSEFSARFSSVIAALLVLCAAFFFIKRFSGPGAATLSCAILSASPLFFVPARLSMPDMVLGLFIILSLFCFYTGWQEQAPKKKTVWYIGFYFFQVLAAWTKGPIGILLPVAVALLSLLREHDKKEFNNLRFFRSMLCVLLASLPWYLYIYFRVDPAAMLRMSESETAGRIFGAMDRPHDPFGFYFAVALPGLLPCTFLIPWAIYKRCRDLESSRLRNFFETWFLCFFVFFTVCALKKPQYIVSLSCVFACWLGTIAWEVFSKNPKKKEPALIVSLIALFASVLAAGSVGLWWTSHHAPETIAGVTLILTAFGSPTALALLLASRNHKRAALFALCMATLASIIPFTNYGNAWLGRYRSMRDFVQEYEPLVGRADKIYSGFRTLNSLVFYLRRPVIIDTNSDSLEKSLIVSNRWICFIPAKKYEENHDKLSGFFVAEKYGKVLLSDMPAASEKPRM